MDLEAAALAVALVEEDLAEVTAVASAVDLEEADLEALAVFVADLAAPIIADRVLDMAITIVPVSLVMVLALVIMATVAEDASAVCWAL